MLPNFWQMYHGEPMLGTTVHRINAALDDGPIVAQQDVSVVPGESLDEVICRTKRHGAKLLQQAIEDIRDGRTNERANDKASASYFTFPTKQDVAEFRRRGHRLL
jgi:methionyl-tRNA formyltransferase